MSEPVSALQGRVATGTVRIEDTGPSGMITLRGDLADAKLQGTVQSVIGADVPERGCKTGAGDRSCLWMSPDELLLLVAYADAASVVAEVSSALAGTHHMVVDVSDARSLLRLTGAGGDLRDTLAKLSPADLRTAACPIGAVRRTRLAQVPAAFWFDDDGTAFVICFRSVSDYVFGLLAQSAAPGSAPGYFRD